jgi:hypothetical protein
MVERAADPSRSADDAELRQEWLDLLREESRKLIAFWMLRHQILKRPKLSLRRLKIAPLHFAVLATLLPTTVAHVAEGGVWVLERLERNHHISASLAANAPTSSSRCGDPGSVKSSSSAERGVCQESAADHKLEGALASVKPIQEAALGFATPLSALLTATFFSRFLRKYNQIYPRTKRAGRVYLYYVSSLLALPNILWAVITVLPAVAHAVWPDTLPDDLEGMVEGQLLKLSGFTNLAVIIWASAGPFRQIFEFDRHGPLKGKRLFLGGVAGTANFYSNIIVVTGFAIIWVGSLVVSYWLS